MRYRPTLEEFVELARDAQPGAGLSPAHRRHAHAGQRLLQDPGRRLGVPLRERRRRRAAGPLQLPRLRAVPALPGVSATRVQIQQTGLPAGGTPRSRNWSIPIRCGCWRKSWPPTARRTCRACRVSAAGPSATPAMTPSATSSACPIRRPTTATCPTSASPSTTAWSSSTTSTRPSPPWPTPTSIRSDLRAQLPGRLRPRGSAGRAACSRASPTCS